MADDRPIREVAVEPVKQYGLLPTDAKGQPIACGANTRLSGERTLAQVGVGSEAVRSLADARQPWREALMAETECSLAPEVR
ncbi:MAG: hypothetical protein KatS3mg055_3029 [Chloroflexus sp.]|uniref:hypothetical protein n=1 Tax=Chloroflexus sp. TaxID=1904827 RepID=UPI0021DD6974|nr:hypothetical protein [Chloroflexus sp.]GIV90511.1 MAG: hypothetical protein KatS3mg055_3029 [Chloroflexus sp.]